MVDNTNNNATNAGKVIYVDPNPKGNIIKTPEDFAISVELVTTKKKRTAIEIVKGGDTYVDTGSSKTKISFIDGSKVNGEGVQKSLTTLYTEVGNNFNKTNTDLETLGISNISIEFNSSYAPMVSIDFVDTRGKLFEMGNNSPYSVFFELPFPVFELTVKGFYGSAVKYKLHLYKFNGKFNSSKGSFEVKCNFIGYTYAFLSDILIGYLKALPYTNIGGKIIDELNALNVGTKNNFLTFDELNVGIKKLSNDIKVLKSDNVDVQVLSLSGKLTSSLSEFKSTFEAEFINILNTTNDITGGGGGGKWGANILTDTTAPTISSVIETYNTNITNKIKELNKNEGGLGSKYPLDLNLFLATEGVTYLKDLTVKGPDVFKGKTKLVSDVYDRVNFILLTNMKLAEEKTVNLFIFDKAIDSINQIIASLSSDSKQIVNTLGDDYTNMVGDAFPDGNFTSSLGDFFRILCNHVDIFLDVIRQVAVAAEKDKIDRKKQLEGIDFGEGLTKFNGGTNDDIGSIKAFPDYREKNTDNTLEDKWIGVKAPNMPEVMLVEEILNGLIKSKIKDDEVLEEITNNESSTTTQDWIPVNPFDTVIYYKSNPYESLKEEGRDYDYLRLSLFRFITLNGFTNSGLTPDEIKAFAIAEANTIFNSIKNNEVKLNFKSLTYASITDGFSSANPNANANYKNYSTKTPSATATPTATTTAFTTGALPTGQLDLSVTTPPNVVSNVKTRVISLATSGERYFYTYTPTKNNDGSLSNKIQFIPFRVDSRKDLSGDSNNDLSNSDRVTQRDGGKKTFYNPLYYVKQAQEDGKRNKLDNGTTFIDFLTISDYNRESPSFVDYVAAGLEKSVEPLTMSAENKITGGLFLGKFGVLDYASIKNSNGIDMLSKTLFYNNPKKTTFFYTAIKEKADNSSYFTVDSNLKVVPMNKTAVTSFESNINPVVVANERYVAITDEVLYGKINKGDLNDVNISNLDLTPGYSLFGSDMYYFQDNFGKAFLFLGSLPIKTGVSTALNETILGLFNYRGGFVDVPYSWILRLGSIIYRMEKGLKGDGDIIKYKTSTYDLAPRGSIEVNLGSNKLLFLSSSDGTNVILDGKISYDIDAIITGFPQQVRDKFSKEFESWVNGDFEKIMSEFEIFKPNTKNVERYKFWGRLNKGLKSNLNVTLKDSILSDNFLKNYNLILANYNDTKYKAGVSSVLTENEVLLEMRKFDSHSYFNFVLGFKPDSEGVKLLKDFIFDSRVITNAAPNIWEKHDVNDTSSHLGVSVTNYKLYYTTLVNTYATLSEDTTITVNTENEVKAQIFNSIDNDDIKLNIYKKLKLIYDKWVCGSSTRYEDIKGDLFDSFKFLDRGYNDITSTFLINPVVMNEHLIGSYNQSFYSYIGKVLPDNNIDFFSLPSYIDYNSSAELSNVFKPYMYNNVPKNSGPSFICMYIGERSSQLNLTEDGSYVDDSFNLNINDDKTLDLTDFPPDMVQGDRKLPVFMVNYGDDNQSVFNDIQLDQSEFTATDEYLTTVDEITNSRGIGQNLFDIYNTRAYTANVEMLGNAMIQPLMYFQLNGIPIFRGLYNIIKVKHDITPNSMKTNFTGVRSRKTKSKLVDKSTIFLNVLGSLSDIVTDGSTLDGSGRTSSGASNSELSKHIIYQLSTGKGIASKTVTNNYGLKDVVDFLTLLGVRWNDFVVGGGKNYSPVIRVNDLSKREGELITTVKDNKTVPTHKSHNNGVDVDIRPFIKDPKANEGVNIKGENSKYSREATDAFFDILLTLNGEYKGWGKNSPINVIYFNDEVIISKYNKKVYNGKSARVQEEKGHDTHLHIQFNTPEALSSGTLDSGIPTEAGLLVKVSAKLVNSNFDSSKKYLGEL